MCFWATKLLYIYILTSMYILNTSIPIKNTTIHKNKKDVGFNSTSYNSSHKSKSLVYELNWQFSGD